MQLDQRCRTTKTRRRMKLTPPRKVECVAESAQGRKRWLRSSGNDAEAIPVAGWRAARLVAVATVLLRIAPAIKLVNEETRMTDEAAPQVAANTQVEMKVVTGVSKAVAVPPRIIIRTVLLVVL